jgi:hypothetical protein
MPCNFVKLPDGGMAIVCSRGHKPTTKVFMAEILDSKMDKLSSVKIEAVDRDAAMVKAVEVAKLNTAAHYVSIGNRTGLVWE